MKKNRSYLNAVFNHKCPQCREGDLFKNRNILKLSKLLSMYEHCPVCNLKYEREVGFWWGTSYINYAMSVLVGFIIALFWAVFFGFSVYDNSVYFFLITTVSLLILLQPFIMRLGRSLYLSFFIKFKPSHAQKK